MTFRDARSQQGFTHDRTDDCDPIIAIYQRYRDARVQHYIDTGEEGVLVHNISTIEIFQEDFRLRNGAYAVDLADIAAITAAIGWNPQAR